ncbi:MAG: hypothetical protein NTW28_25960 [Candidatus Solibacter sp.]|nr:hypothetical protein [Candidatus Solibacter sp.]
MRLPCSQLTHPRILVVVLGLSAVAFAQRVDSVVLVNNGVASRVAADSRGNILALVGQAVQRYSPQGDLLEQLPGTLAACAPAVIGIDRQDHVYAGCSNGGVQLVRADQPTAQQAWKPAVAGAPMEFLAMAFDREENPVLLLTDPYPRTLKNAIRVVKLDRSSGAILGDFRLGKGYDQGTALALDAAGAIYVTGSAYSVDFPLTPGAYQTAWPDACGIGPEGYHNCPQGFVTKIDPTLQTIVYSTLLDSIFATGIALGPDASAYVAGALLNGPGKVFRLDASGSNLLGSTSIYASDVKVDAAGNPIVLGFSRPDEWTAPAVPPCGPRTTYAARVTKFDPLLSEVKSSVFLPQALVRGSSALLADGSLYLLDGANRISHVTPDAAASPVACIVNGASLLLETSIVPGQLLTILGQGLGPDELIGFDSSAPLPASAAGTEVHIGGMPAPLLAVGSKQINAIVPFGVDPRQQASVEIRRDGAVVFTSQMNVDPVKPTPLLRFDSRGLVTYTIYSRTDAQVFPLADAINQDGTRNSAEHPAAPGSVVTVYATGMGTLTPGAADGAPGDTIATPRIGEIYVRGDYIYAPIKAVVTTVAGRTNAVLAVQFAAPGSGGSGVAVSRFWFSADAGGPTLGLASAFLYVGQ